MECCESKCQKLKLQISGLYGCGGGEWRGGVGVAMFLNYGNRRGKLNNRGNMVTINLTK